MGAELKIELLQIREAPASISTEGKRKKTYPKGILTFFLNSKELILRLTGVGPETNNPLPQWEDSGVDIALQAINIPAHKQHIFEHLKVKAILLLDISVQI